MLFNQYGKYDGFYTKSLNKTSHLIYIGFIKPRFSKNFRKQFKNIELFSSEKTKLVTLEEAVEIQKTLKKNASKLRDSRQNIRNLDEIKEILSTESFIKIKNIPSK